MMAASWDPKTNTTYAYLHCRADPDERSIERLKTFLREMAPTALDPVLLPVLVMDLETDLTLRDDFTFHCEILDIEAKTGGGGEADILAFDLHSIVQSLNASSVFLSKIERDCESALLHLEKAKKMISETAEMCSLITKQSETLHRHVEFLIDSRKDIFYRLQNLQRRSQTRLALVSRYYQAHNFKLTKILLRSITSWHKGITN
jgi:uncharacterized protein YfcZ (UPF0381/DUF406 family)